MEETKKKEKPLILIAEDHLVNQKVFSLLLDKLGYDYIIANNGEEALEKFKNTEPSLVFMDMLMPKMNGCEAAKIMREQGYSKPIIAVTANDLPEEINTCIEAGMNEVLVKPIKRSSVEKILEKWLGKADEKPSNPTSIPKEGTDTQKIISVFDEVGMLDTFMNDVEATLPLLSRFIDRTKLQLENIPLLFKNGDFESAFRDAHTIKGAAFTMGGMELGKAASRLEFACRNTDKNEAEAAYPPLCEAFIAYKKAAEDFIHSRRKL